MTPEPRFLIDECLSPVLAAHLRGRGFRAEHVNEVKAKRKLDRLSDGEAAAYALARDLIVVTNNMLDFERIYLGKPVHPGLIFLSAPENDLFSKRNQLAMIEDALKEVAKREPIQELIHVMIVGVDANGLQVEVTRRGLPPLAEGSPT